jgi:hypothetical protein
VAHTLNAMTGLVRPPPAASRSDDRRPFLHLIVRLKPRRSRSNDLVTSINGQRGIHASPSTRDHAHPHHSRHRQRAAHRPRTIPRGACRDVQRLPYPARCNRQADHVQRAPVASIGSKPIHPMPWAEIAPPIAGLPSHYTPEQRVTFLRTGKRPDGSTPRPPMPPYQWSHGDAVAVTAWLRYMKQ